MSREHLRLAESRQADPQRLAMLVYNLVSTTMHTELLAPQSAQSDAARRARLADDIWLFCCRAVAT